MHSGIDRDGAHTTVGTEGGGRRGEGNGIEEGGGRGGRKKYATMER